MPHCNHTGGAKFINGDASYSRSQLTQSKSLRGLRDWDGSRIDLYEVSTDRDVQKA